jgi:hypothetical protein
MSRRLILAVAGLLASPLPANAATAIATASATILSPASVRAADMGNAQSSHDGAADWFRQTNARTPVLGNAVSGTDRHRLTSQPARGALDRPDAGTWPVIIEFE